MKIITAIIQPPKLQTVLAALSKVSVERLTVCDSQGFGRQRGQTATYRGHEYKIQFLRKVVLEIVVNDDFLDRTVDTVVQAARSGPDGEIGDGKIFITPVAEAIQIDTGLRGPEAV
ncbi:MAG: P-II family nitrogen regulator [Pirellulaceae bacterium]